MLLPWCFILKKKKKTQNLRTQETAWRAALGNKSEGVRRFWLSKQSAFMKHLSCSLSLGTYNTIICGAWLSKGMSLREWEFWKQGEKRAWSNVIRQGALEPWGTINKGSGTCLLWSLDLFRERFSNSGHGVCFLFLSSTHCGSESIWMFLLITSWKHPWLRWA